MSNVEVSNEAIVPNAKRLLLAGFMAILAAGVGFGIRGGILANWGADFGFTGQQLGDINGAGFTGFCFGIVRKLRRGDWQLSARDRSSQAMILIDDVAADYIHSLAI